MCILHILCQSVSELHVDSALRSPPPRSAAGSPTWTWTPSTRRWNCCATPTWPGSRWSSAAAGATSRSCWPTARAAMPRWPATPAAAWSPPPPTRRATYGVHSGMGLMKAAALAPQAVLLPVDFEQYRLYSRRFKAAVAEVAPVIEDRGIDEIYIDLTDVPGAQDSAGPRPARRRARRGAADPQQRAQRHRPDLLDRRHAQQAAGQDRQRTGQARRPDGAHRRPTCPTRIWPLPVRRINGIGPKAAAQLAGAGHPHRGRAGGVRPRLAGGRTSAAPTAAGCSTPRTASTTGRW